MKIFSSHRRKLEPKRRFGGREFQNKVKAQLNYKRVFNQPRVGWFNNLWYKIGLGSKIWRWSVFVVFVLIFYFLVLSPRFVIANIKVSGNSQINTQQILDVLNHEGNNRIFLMKKASFFLMSRGMVNKILTTNIPTIKSVTEYKRIWPNSAELTVEERTPGFALRSNGKYFLVDDEGTVVKPLSDPEGLILADDTVIED
ncbi:MAG TPA: FtsQ-type POTRA domain-containing protein, partial [Methylomirabilota bacterium]|nr:FtsQ-type POTRA domain-containing protein [Methylomirabilota bacterium]